MFNKRDYPMNGRNWQRRFVLTTCISTKFIQLTLLKMFYVYFYNIFKYVNGTVLHF